MSHKGKTQPISFSSGCRKGFSSGYGKALTVGSLLLDAMDPLVAILLGVLQGFTEWLPISSSGHLVLAQYFTGVTPPVSFDLLLHLATLVAVLFAFRTDLLRMVLALFGIGDSKTLIMADRRMMFLIIVGTIPAVIVGFLLRDVFETLYASPAAVAAALMLTGSILWSTQHTRPRKNTDKLGPLEVLIIGAAQALAIVPGISRSGSTISTGMYLGYKKEAVARFSFLLSIPAILGATVLYLPELRTATASPDWSSFLLGAIAAAFVGYASIKLLLEVIRRKGFHYFSFYCWGLGGLVLVLLVLGV